MVQVAVTDLAAYLDDEITAMPNLVQTGALDAGSITSGFTSIDVGSGAITTTGVITGGTVEATTDTAAGDNAAMGFTSAEGLILTGQGSTNDVTIKNDADAIVMQIATGGTATEFIGNVTVGGNLDVTGRYGAADKYTLATGIANNNNGVIYNGNGSTTSFAISPGHTSYSVLVFNNGVAQIPGVAYQVSGNAVDFSITRLKIWHRFTNKMHNKEIQVGLM